MKDTPTRILLVEDNSLDVRLLREKLKEQAPQTFVLTEVGFMSEAESHLATNAVDVILLDLGLPDAQGLEAVRRARAAAPHIPLVVLTGCDDELMADRALREGAQDFLVKGKIETPELLRAIRYATQRVKAEFEMQKAQEEAENASSVKGELLAELKAAHAETELFLRSIPSIVIGIDPRGRITRWNQTATSTFGIEDHSVVGRPIEDCGIRWLHSEIRAEIARWLATESSYRSDNLTYEQDGKTRFLGLNVLRVPAKAGEQSGFIITGADVTDRMGLELQLRQAQKLEGIGQLAAGIAHEINTPTQFVGDNIRFLKDSWGPVAEFMNFCGTMQSECGAAGPVSPEHLQRFCELFQKCDLEYLSEHIPKALDLSLEGVKRIAKIVKGFKEFSHPGSEEKRAINLNQAIETTISVARHEWKYCADLVTNFDAELPLVPCLVGEFNQVMLNLIVNSAHAITSEVEKNGNGKGTITISTQREGEWARVAVADTGAGIPVEIRSRVFEPFFTTKEVGKGTGQGLAIAHAAIVNRHHGQLWFESELGQGTTFFIRLPLGMETPAHE